MKSPKQSKAPTKKLICPRCQAQFKHTKAFQAHLKVQVRSCKVKERLLAGGKRDRYLEWMGNKYRVREVIAKYVPKKVSTVVSPFFGSGAVEFQLLRERPDLKVLASDLDKALVTFWQQLQRSPKGLVASIEKKMPRDDIIRRNLFDHWRSSLQGNIKELGSDIDIASAFWLVNKLTFNGFMTGKVCSYQEPQAKKLFDFREKRMKHLLAYEALPTRRLQLKTCDCFKAIRQSPPDALLFLDPPYLGTAQYREDGMFGTALHQELKELLASLDKWILCHEDSPDVRSLYAGFDAIEYTQFSAIKQGGLRQAAVKKEDTRRKELLVLSPWVSQQLRAQQKKAGVTGLVSLSAPSEASTVGARFEEQCQQLQEWINSHGGAHPSQNSSQPEEQKLATFCNRVQSQLRKDMLGARQKERLCMIPEMESRFEGWMSLPKFVPRKDLNRVRCGELREWVQKNPGALPRSSGQEMSAEEKRLCTFLSRMMRMCERGQLPKDIANELEKLPGVDKKMKRCQERQLSLKRAKTK